MYLMAQLKHYLFIYLFICFLHLIPPDRVFVICASSMPHVFPDRLDYKNL